MRTRSQYARDDAGPRLSAYRAVYITIVSLSCFMNCASSVTVSVDSKIIATTNENYVSYTMDTGKLLQLDFLLNTTRLVNLAKNLSPAFLRVGGTIADGVYYDMSTNPVSSPPPNFKSVLTAARWNELSQLVEGARATLVFGINGGPGPRPGTGRDRAWNGDNAASLLKYASSMNQSVWGWELGNEPNLFPFNWGLDAFVSGSQLAKDYTAFHSLVQSHTPSSRVVGCDTAFQIPVLGEIFPLYQDFMTAVNASVIDAITWHWYPAVSNNKMKVDPWKPTPKDMLQPWLMDKYIKYSDVVNEYARKYTPSAPVFVGEMANCADGGQPNVSDVWAASFWYADQLGSMAARGNAVIARQEIVGGNYGLLTDSLVPNPDYFVALIFKSLMGTSVLSASSDTPAVRVYAQCGHQASSVVLLIINTLSSTEQVSITGSLANLLTDNTVRSDYTLTSDSLTSSQLKLNGQLLTVNADGTLPPMPPGVTTSGSKSGVLSVNMAPESIQFSVLDNLADTSPCS